MSDFKDEITFVNSGLNSDDDPRYYTKGDTNERVNVEVFQIDGIGVINNVRGNELIDFSLPAGSNKVISTVEDLKRDQLIYFVYNSNGDHKILAYKNGSVTDIIAGLSLTGLNFQDNFKNRINSVVFGDILAWVDDFNPARKVNIAEIESRPYIEEDQTYVYDLLKSPYQGIIDAYFIADSNEVFSNINHALIDGGMYQFAIQYVYDDSELSVVSNYSIPAKSYKEFTLGFFDVTFELQTKSRTIKTINILFRKDFSTTLFLWKEINLKYDTSITTTDKIYTRNVTGDYIEQTTLIEGIVYHIPYSGTESHQDVITDDLLFSVIPERSKTIEFANNRLFFANNLIGLEQVDTGVLLFEEINIDKSPTSGQIFTGSITSTTLTITINPVFPTIWPVSGPPSNQYYSMRVIFGLTIDIDTAVVAFIPTVYFPEGTSFEEFDAVVRSQARVVTYNPNFGANDNIVYYAFGDGDTVEITVTSGESITSDSASTNIGNGSASALGFKKGSRYQFYPMFWDDYGRTTGPLLNNDNIFITSNDYDPFINSDIIGLSWTLGAGFEIPSWAKYFSLATSPNLDYSASWEYKGDYIEADNALKAPPSYTSFEIGDIVIVPSYDPEQRFIIENRVEVIDSETEIGWLILEPLAIGVFKDLASPNYQLLRPRSAPSTFVSEITQRYPIINNVIETDTGSDTGIINNGDTSIEADILGAESLVGPNNIVAFLQSYEALNLGGVSINIFGKITPIIIGTIPRYYQNIYYTEVYFDNTSINGTATVLPLNVYESDDLYGTISRIINIGDVLKIYQQKKVTSIYLGKTEYFDSQGGQGQIGQTTDVLGSNRVSFQDYGTDFLNAVVKNDRYVYFYDHRNQAVIRDSANGLFNISEYKMNKYFKVNLSSLLSGVPLIDFNIHLSYDQENELLYIIFDHNFTSTLKAIGFHEPSNRWISFYEFKDSNDNYPEISMSLNNEYFTFLNGSIYRHNASNRCVFYGDNKDCSINIWGVLNSNLIKKFDTIHIHSEGVFKNLIEIPKNDTYGIMNSNIQSSEFNLIEGVYKSQYYRNTNQAGPEVVLKYNGENLRGYIINNILIAEDPQSNIKIFKIDINSTRSNS